jgi:hydrogenase maturation protein HypF
MWSALLDDLRRGIERSRIAARFHIGLAHAVAELAVKLAHGRSQTVVVSGGCMQNRILLERVIDRVEALGLRCLANVRVPANDGGVAFGQAVVAAARCLQERTNS